MYHYSPTQNTFYPDELKQVYIDAGTFPDDTVEVSDDVWMEFAGNHPPEGKQRAAGHDNLPCWVDIRYRILKTRAAENTTTSTAGATSRKTRITPSRLTITKWDYGKATQERLSLSVQMAKQNKLPAGFIWTDADNNDVPMTAGELLSLSDAIDQAMFTKGLQIHMRQREMKEEIDGMTDVKAIQDYKVDWAKGN
ncbi:phage tail assembly protein [Salmonella enterica subsp. arizonae]|uniref:Phage tail assembly protein n=1 Tax=Salmonella enterica subsp. arizonae TaxID=59203 RepID=A0A447QXU6_SALER|nr:phage tail assembly protein [Salmonella enterica subsp. arizonae]